MPNGSSGSPPRLIALMGGECSGKTTLTQALAQHFGGLWMPEYLRSFCQLHGRTPRPGEQRQIVLCQLQAQRQALAQARRSAAGWVFCDTTALQTAVYSDFYFADMSLYRRSHALHARYALTLLLAPDLPWQADGLQRDGCAARDAIHAVLQQNLLAARHRTRLISGIGPARLQAAITAITDFR